MSQFRDGANSGPVLGYGAVAVDSILYVDNPMSDGKGRVLAQETQYGGNIATALATVTALGGEASFIGILPDPVEWPGVFEDFAAQSVHVQDGRIIAGAAPIRSTIVVGPEGYRFIAFDDDVPMGAPSDLALDLLKDAGCLLVDQYGPLNSLPVVRAARAKQIPVIADFERITTPAAFELLEIVDHLVIPRSLAAELSTETDPFRAVNALWNENRTAVVITDGDHGSWYRSATDHDVQHRLAFKVEVVDTTGCGDIFHGAYAAALAGGATVSGAILVASAAAAIGATARGGRGHLPTAREVHRLIESGEMIS